MSPTRGLLRALRASIVSAVCTAACLAGHVLAGGSRPGTLVLVIVVTLLCGAAFVGSRARWTFGRLLLLLGAGQVGFHLLFTVAGEHPDTVGGHAPAPAELAGSVTMAAAHLVAALVLAGLLTWGESWLWRVVAALNTALHVAADGVREVAQAALRITAAWAAAQRLLSSRHGTAAAARLAGRRSRIPVVLTALRSALLTYATPRRGPPRTSLS
jgi:hypothetical protein